ncbi:MAG: glycosyltransferase family 39 protein [Pseudomonadota bacterium]
MTAGTSSDDCLSRRWVMALVGFLLLSFFVNLGGVPLFDEDEGAYAEVTREMIASGDFITPRLNGMPFFHKPPMIYWVQAAGVAVFGENEFALRLPSALAATLWVLAVFAFARRTIGPSAAWYAAIFLISGLQTGIIAKAAIADALLNLFITLTCFQIFDYTTGGRRRHIIAAFGFMALGVMAKGPIAIAIPLVASGVFFTVQKRFRDWLRAIFYPGGWLVFLLIAAPWYLMLYRIHGRAFIDEFFFTQNVDRFRVAFEGHSGSVLYYLPVLIIGVMPHTAFLLKGAASLRAFWKIPVNRFGLIWFAFVLVFFSLAGTKLHHYIVYGYPPVLLMMAQVVDGVRRRWTITAWPAAFALILVFIPMVVSVAPRFISDDFARYVVAGVARDIGWRHGWAAVVALVLLVGVPRWGRVSRRGHVMLNAVVFVVLVNGWVVPVVGDVMQVPIKEAAQLARRQNLDVVMWQMTYPSFSFYRGRAVPNRQPAAGEIVITKRTKLDTVSRHEVIYEKNGIVMTKILSFKQQ